MSAIAIFHQLSYGIGGDRTDGRIRRVRFAHLIQRAVVSEPASSRGCSEILELLPYVDESSSG
jgi:hypothetical protein